jgi:DNA-binding winged helix-turn-helix (wHTH) protein/Tfp pilus assembly protein PilF
MIPARREGTGDSGPQRLFFETFELRLDSGELLRRGSPVKLQPQPARILEILASHSGEVVSREKIRRLVWGDSYVDSDASLNFCIKEIRRALGDSATLPRFIETVPRRGYRFLKPVKLAPEAGEPAVELTRPSKLRRSRLATISVTLALLILTLLAGSRIGKRLAVRSKPSSPASEAYLRGVYLRRHEQAEKAVATFQEAVLLDPGFAAAFAALAEARLQLQPPADLGATEAAARRALALDPDLAEAHLVLGKILLSHYRDWHSAGRELQAAVALAPESADAHHEYSLYLAALGRQAEAIASVRRARELDPASMLVGSDYAWYFYLDHRYEEAIRQAEIVLKLFPQSADTATMAAKAGRLYCEETILNSAWALGDHETALEAAKALQGFFKPPQEAARLRDANEFWHSREERIEALQRTRLLDPFVRAKNAMSLGDRHRALDLLTAACAPSGMAMPFAAVEPLFDPLHADPRWSQVLDCLKLPPDAPARQALSNRKL